MGSAYGISVKPGTIGPGHSLLMYKATKLDSLLYKTVRTEAPSERDLVWHDKDLSPV